MMRAELALGDVVMSEREVDRTVRARIIARMPAHETCPVMTAFLSEGSHLPSPSSEFTSRPQPHEKPAPTDARLKPTSSARFLDAAVPLRAISIFEVSEIELAGRTLNLTIVLGHIRSHNEERPFKCKWPGCDKGFARQHDCKRHEALHLNIRPYTCEGCQKTFARMDALNRHCKSQTEIAQDLR
jgi:hypothetical protein